MGESPPNALDHALMGERPPLRGSRVTCAAYRGRSVGGRSAGSALALLLLAAALVVACGDAPPAPTLHDASVTFVVKTADGVTTKPATTVLVAKKQGARGIVAAPADEAPADSTSGRHAFPPGVTAGAIAAYYEGLLRNAGWGDADRRAERKAGRIRLLRVTDLHGWAESDEVEVRLQAALK